jgi:hypothetical protein
MSPIDSLQGYRHAPAPIASRWPNGVMDVTFWEDLKYDVFMTTCTLG